MARATKTGGKKSRAKARKAGPAKGPKTAKTKRQIAPAAKPRKGSSVADLEAQLKLRTKEAEEFRQQQAATTEILKVINSSKGDLTPVFDIILQKAHQLCGVTSGSLQLIDGDHIRAVAVRGHTEAFGNFLRQGFRVTERIRQLDPVQHVDLVEVLFRAPNEAIRAAVELGGIRTSLLIPLVKDGVALGRIFAARREVRPFTNQQIELLKSFADQAVIAIQNARLFNETKEALEQQTATSEILRIISGSPTDVTPVFDAIAERARVLCGASIGFTTRVDGELLHLVGYHGVSPQAEGMMRTSFPRKPDASSISGRCFQAKAPVQIANVELEPEYGLNSAAKVADYRSLLAVPMLQGAQSIGVVGVGRQEPGAFSAKLISLLQTFADQAVIAIQNARLFNETKEALERQTATADILKVIASSPSDLQPVLDALVHTAARLCDTEMAFIMRREDDFYRAGAAVGYSNEYIEFLRNHPLKVDRGTITGRAVLERRTVQILDVAADPEYMLRESTTLAHQRTALCVPLLRGNEPIGTIVLARQRVEPFTQKQIDLVTTFADQAVIAIENVRLFDELRHRTDDLSEALAYQTGSGNILRVIASSPTEVGPVLKAIVESACELCEAYDAEVYLKEGDDLRHSAHHGPIPIGMDKWLIDRSWVTGRSVMDKVPTHVHDLLSAEGDEFPKGQEMSRAKGFRTVLSVPLLGEGESVGAIVLRRTEVHPFSDKQIALLQTFADQAVIAIQNVKLFEEVQAKTRDLTESLDQQTATADVLKVISCSPGDLEPVFKAMLENAVRICDAKFGNLLLMDGDNAHWAAGVATPLELARYLQSASFRPTPGSHLDRVMRTKQVSHATDDTTQAVVGASARLGGARSTVCVPMVKDEVLVGAIFMYRTEVRPFTDKQIDLVKNFAAQAVIAIENTRLLNQLRQRTADLSRSLDELRTAQDRLVQTEKLASLGQLTAGIAHEIKNPLNFVNNFSSLSVELVDELAEGLRSIALDDNQQAEFGELTETLRGNLQKVVQHGKRADSIVKNMLLHSREGSGEHRSVDINALVDESLNLAYHGARAEKPQFNITLQRDFDERAGTLEVFPQEITRAFLNLISNGFYAATQHAAENGGSDFQPTLTATTKNLGDSVQIRIRDNGTGIPAEVKEKMFNPFFTTKPAGEGTGLGLSMSHDIIVKQHGGSIDVESVPGGFTEFTIVLPRMSTLQSKKRGAA